MATLTFLKHELLADAEFARAYAAVQPELSAMRAIADACTSQYHTQKEAPERMAVAQVEIGELANDTLSTDKTDTLEVATIRHQG